MKFSFCPDCGAALEPRDLGDEIGVPWCVRCDRPWFPVFPVAAIVLVIGPDGRVLLLRQNYISTEFRNLVSGYVAPGETAEQCARREVRELRRGRPDRLEDDRHGALLGVGVGDREGDALAELLEMWANGVKIRAIASWFDVTPASVKAVMQRNRELFPKRNAA